MESRNQAFIRAAEEGNPEEISRLILAGAEVDARNEYGMTAIWLAAKMGHQAVVKQLIDAKADLEFKDDFCGDTPLLRASAQGHAAIVSLLVNARANITATDRFGGTALISAICEERVDVVDYLLTIRLNLEAKDKAGNTALAVAVRAGYEGLVTRLLQAKANPEAKNNDGETPTLIAQKHNHPAIAAQLTEAVKQNHYMKHQRQIAVLSGLHSRTGKLSIFAKATQSLFEPNVCRIIRDLAGDAIKPKSLKPSK